MPTKVLKCGCISGYQDGKYGSGKRLFNQCDRAGKVAWRCTVCSSVVEKDVREEDVTEEQEES